MSVELLKTLSVCLILYFYFSCNSENKNKTEENTLTSEADSINQPIYNDTLIDLLKEDTLPQIIFKMLILNDSIRNQLPKQFPDSNLITICALNRIDPNRLHRADSLMIPDSIYLNLINYSPYPLKFHKADSIEKLILVSYPLQAFALYQEGKLLRWGPVSMGAKNSKTPTGLFHTNWKSKSQISTDNSSWILPWYFNIINHTGVSFHQYELPGFPASHSCIRLRQSDAEYIYYFAEQWKLDEKGMIILAEGTPVIIFGEYPFGTPRPWFKAAVNPDSTKYTEENLDEIIKPYLEKIVKEQIKRNEYLRLLSKETAKKDSIS